MQGIDRCHRPGTARLFWRSARSHHHRKRRPTIALVGAAIPVAQNPLCLGESLVLARFEAFDLLDHSRHLRMRAVREIELVSMKLLGAYRGIHPKGFER